ncbi:MAG: hypothetical protein F9K23_00660 [Bacteroidetes bacterium]|nr:MAG: hypothetical protein F9K23_00660 [Bacteroidota bacterium]
MATIVTRAGKGSALTHNEVDANFNNLNAAKLENTVWDDDSTIVIRDKDGNLAAVVIGELMLVGRNTGGNITGLSAADVKTILAVAIADVDGLQAALDAKLALSAYSANNTIVYKNNSGTMAAITVAASQLVGRKATGEITNLTAAEAKTILAIAIADVTALQDALDAKADDADLTTTTGYFNGKKQVHNGQVTLVAGVASVSWAGFTDIDEIKLYRQSAGANMGHLFPDDRNGGVGFSINSTDPADVGTIYYEVWRSI